MNFNELNLLTSLNPSVESKVFQKGSSFLVGFISPEGFKDIQKSAVFGFCKYGPEFIELIHELTVWARQKQMSALVGPLNYSTILDYRLKTNHFELDPFLGEPQNSANELNTLLNLGFAALESYESKTIPLNSDLLQQLESLKKVILNSSTSQDYKIEKIKVDEVINNLENFYDLTDQIFKENFCYQKIPYPLFKNYFINNLGPLICTETSILLKNKNGQYCGYALNFKDSRNPKNLLVKTVGVIPSDRKMGLTFLQILLHSLEEAFKKYASATLCLMKKGNFPDLLSQESFTEATTYSLFIKKI